MPDGQGGYAGYLSCGGHRYAFRVGALPARTFEADPSLRVALEGQEAALEQRLQRSSDAATFIAEVADLLDRPAHASASPALPPASFYEIIIRELDAAGWGSLLSVSPSLDHLQLLVQDAAGRAHTLGLTIPPGYPYTPPQAHVALPEPFTPRWPVNSVTGVPLYSLSIAIEQFQAALARHQRLWDMLDDIDEHTWVAAPPPPLSLGFGLDCACPSWQVLEPKSPRRDCLTRRIAIGSHCSLEIELHVAVPSSLPIMQFLGAERIIAPLRQALNANLARWQSSRSVRLNIEEVLEMQFPAPHKGSEGEDSYAAECAICYSFHLDGAAPEIACDGCSKPFHKACLSEWLRGLATTQQSFNRLFGASPLSAIVARSMLFTSSISACPPMPVQASVHIAAAPSPSRLCQRVDAWRETTDALLVS